MSEHVNLQPIKTSKIFGVMKMGANNTDKKVIKSLQQQGYDEHEIQHQAGVHFLVVRSFMKLNDPSFKIKDAPVTQETKPLHDRIAELEKQNAAIQKKNATPNPVVKTAPLVKAKPVAKPVAKAASPKPKPSNPKPQVASAVTANDY